MKTSKPLLWGEFSLQNLTTDYDDLIDLFDELDPDIPENVLEIVKKFEIDREITIELWRKEQFEKRDLGDQNIRLANLFEICAFRSYFDRAHIEYGEYSGFDSIVGKLMSECYCPLVYEVERDAGSGLYLANPERESVSDYRLVVTKEKIL